MYIKEIEFEDFKSFEGNHKITFKEGFNCITGANGSGKSNIIDGIKFALGFLNIKLHDKDGLGLISNNCDKDEASVKIICVDKDNNSEFSIKRVVNRNLGNLWLDGAPPKKTMLYNDDIFYINDKSIKRPEFNLFLEKHNIRQDLLRMATKPQFSSCEYNILEQDDVWEYMLNPRIFGSHFDFSQDEKECIEALKIINFDFSKIYEFLSNKKCEHSLIKQSDSLWDSIVFVRIFEVEKFIGLTNSEKLLSVLAYFFAIQKYLKSPFNVFDCIDCSLDENTQKRLTDYIKQQSKDRQYIVVSLQKTMLENADNVITLNKKD